MMISAKSRALTTRVRCEKKDRLEGVKRVNASRVQNIMLAFSALKVALDKELALKNTMKDEMLKIVKADINSIRITYEKPEVVEDNVDVVAPTAEEPQSMPDVQ
jgi:hypothetical protein